MRILKRTAGMLENTEKKAQEWRKNKTLQRVTGSNPTQSPTPCHSPSGTCIIRDQNKPNATDVTKILKSAAKLIKNLGPAGREKQETKVDKMTRMDIWTKKPPEKKNTGNVDPEDPIKPGATMEEIWFAIAGSPKPAKDDSDESTDAPEMRILHINRARRRRHPCGRGTCMTLQAPRRRRGRHIVTKLKNQDVIIKAYFKNRGGRHGEVGKPRQLAPIEQNRADWTYDPGLRRTANNKWTEAN